MADQTETDRLLHTRSDPGVKLYKYRWFILALYSLTALSSTLIWLSFISVSDATAECDDEIVQASSAIAFLQVVFAIPMAFVPARFGLRKTMIAVGTFNAITAILTLVSPTWTGFYSYLAGQFVATISNSILPHLAPETSAVWFGKQEQATSTSIGIIMGSLGADIAFLRPAKRLFNLTDDEFTLLVSGSKLKDFVHIQIAFCAVLLVLIVFMYKERPPLPPSAEEARRRKPGDMSFSKFYKCIKDLSWNANFLRVGNALALASALLVIVTNVFSAALVRQARSRAALALVGYFNIATGFIGCICFGKFLAKSEAHTRLAIGLSVAMITLLLIIISVLLLGTGTSFVIIISLFAAYQFLLFPFVQLLVDVMSEICYPTPNTIAYVISIAVSRSYSLLLFYLAMNATLIGSYFPFVLMALVILFCLFLAFYSKVRRNRPAVETKMATDLVVDKV